MKITMCVHSVTELSSCNLALELQLQHRSRNHGGSGGWCPPMFSDSYIARLNFIHTDHTALAYRSIEPPLPNHLPTLNKGSIPCMGAPQLFSKLWQPQDHYTSMLAVHPFPNSKQLYSISYSIAPVSAVYVNHKAHHVLIIK